MANEKKFSSSPRIRIYSPIDLGKKWFVEYYQDGRRQREYGTINQGKDFETRMATAKSLQKQIIKKLTGSVTKKTLHQQAIDWMQSRSWRPKTYSTFNSCVTAFFDFIGERKITEPLVKEFFDLIRRTKSPTTYNKYFNNVSAVLLGINQVDIKSMVGKTKQNPTPSRYFQPHDVKKLAKVISTESPELWLFVQFMYYCFIRPRELVKLRAGNIILELGQIYIPGEVSKNKKSEYVSIPKAFLGQLLFVQDMDANELLFHSKKDPTKHIGENTMYRRHLIFLNRLRFGLGYTLYSWKHTGAVSAVKAGITLKELQIQLRHHSLDQVDQYLRQMGVLDLVNLQENFPAI